MYHFVKNFIFYYPTQTYNTRFKSAFAICSTSLLFASFLQYTLINQNQWLWITSATATNATFSGSIFYKQQQNTHPTKIITIDTTNANSSLNVSMLSTKIKSE